MCDVRYSATSVLLLSFLCTAGYAQGVTVHGVGMDSCGQYLSAAHNQPPGRYKVIKRSEGEFFDDHGRYIEWLLGFITATNRTSFSAGTSGNIQTDAAALDVWIRKWCEQNPTQVVSEAAWAFTEDQRR